MSANNVGRSSFFEMTFEPTRASTQDLSHIHVIYAGKLLNIYLIVIDIKIQTTQVLHYICSIWLSVNARINNTFLHNIILFF